MARRTSLRRVAALMLLAAAAGAGWPAESRGDSLRQAAVPSALASHSVLTAAARAGTRIVAAGERGHIVYSDDGGATWLQARVPVSVTLTALYFADDSHGWATGHSGVILATDDGGLSWTKQLDGLGVIAAMEAAGAADQQWAQHAADLKKDGPDKPFLDIYFRDARHGTVIGAYGLVFRTDDGGRSWHPALDLLDNPENKHLYAIRAAGNMVYIAGEQGALFRSTDGGDTFERLATPYAGSFFGLTIAPAGQVMAYGLRGNLYLSTDQGRHWRKIDLGSEQSLNAGTVLADGTVALVDQAGTVWLARDPAQGFKPAPSHGSFPFAAIVPGGPSLIAVGIRGVARLTLAAGQQVGRVEREP